MRQIFVSLSIQIYFDQFQYSIFIFSISSPLPPTTFSPHIKSILLQFLSSHVVTNNMYLFLFLCLFLFYCLIIFIHLISELNSLAISHTSTSDIVDQSSYTSIISIHVMSTMNSE